MKKTAIPKSDESSHGMYHQLLSMKPHQLITMKHMVKQELGHPSTHFHPKYDSLGFTEAQKRIMNRQRVTEAFHSPVSLAETYRKHHERGGSLGSAVTTGLKKTVDMLKVVGKKALEYGKKGIEYIAKHPEVIPKIIEGVTTAVEIVGQMKGKKEEEKVDFQDDPFTSDEDEKASGVNASGVNASGVKAGSISKKEMAIENKAVMKLKAWKKSDRGKADMVRLRKDEKQWKAKKAGSGRFTL